jgi:hypothetical protein
MRCDLNEKFGIECDRNAPQHGNRWNSLTSFNVDKRLPGDASACSQFVLRKFQIHASLAHSLTKSEGKARLGMSGICSFPSTSSRKRRAFAAGKAKVIIVTGSADARSGP